MELKPHLKKYWRIPPRGNAAFVACMEDVLEVYARPYAASRPVLCMDETNKQLIGEVRNKIPARPGKPERWEHEYVRNGVAQVFLEVEPLTECLEIHYTPKHGSWLNIAEIKLSALCGQCLNRCIPDLAIMRQQINAWERDRNNRQSKVDWQFTTQDARIKLKSLYPKL